MSLHRFSADISGIELPVRFNNPFHYTPHLLCLMAADEVKHYLSSRVAGKGGEEGKMFGVLVVRSADGMVGFIAAFSGLLDGNNAEPYFVPPVFDMLAPNGCFKRGEAEISEINRRVEEMKKSEGYLHARDELADSLSAADKELSAMRKEMRLSKLRRDAMRATATLEESATLVRESQFQKAELKRLSNRWKQHIDLCRNALSQYEAQIAELKEERKRRSAELQEWLFRSFVMLNARGEKRDLIEIFKEYRGCLPPAGTGECAAPKLLQYAFMNNLEPLCMAEFWLGAPPAGELRRDGCFYGSCKGKCEPILAFMLQGLEVEHSPLEDAGGRFNTLEVVYEDEYLLVVDKPAGMLSVPGIVGGTSVQEWLQQRYADSELRVVHRLDMATSGLLIAAKSLEAYKSMQRLFALGEVEKRYIALLDGVPVIEEGSLNLPIAPDYMNRPRQMVDFDKGKSAVTRYKVLSLQEHNGSNRAVVELFPLTGRTHQLRLHCAHSAGLDIPIVGDELYGTPDKRLMLHAQRVSFVHPFSQEKIDICSNRDTDIFGG